MPFTSGKGESVFGAIALYVIGRRFSLELPVRCSFPTLNHWTQLGQGKLCLIFPLFAIKFPLIALSDLTLMVRCVIKDP